jgi:hypothetical protein
MDAPKLLRSEHIECTRSDLNAFWSQCLRLLSYPNPDSLTNVLLSPLTGAKNSSTLRRSGVPNRCELAVS